MYSMNGLISALLTTSFTSGDLRGLLLTKLNMLLALSVKAVDSYPTGVFDFISSRNHS